MLKDSIKNFEERVETFMDSDEFSFVTAKEIESLYNTITNELLQDSSEEVKKYLLNPEENDCPLEVKPLKKYKKFHKHIYKYYSEKIKDSIKSGDETVVFDYLAQAVELDVKNVVLVEEISSRFKKSEKLEELIKLYKIMFVRTVKPKYFEKIADLYVKLGQYDEAINYYLNYCESVEPSAKVYYKLAETFAKNNDTESMQSCLEFAKKLEAENEL